jgi:L-fuculose-phosphate aldolase
MGSEETMTPHASEQTRSELARYSARLVSRGLVVGPGGNTSARDGEIMWISPSGFALDDIGVDDWVVMDIASGEARQRTPRPSSEFAMHLAIYRARPDVSAIVHTHPPTTIGVISAGIDRIPFMFPDQVAVVGDVPFIGYVVPCSQELADAVVAAMGDEDVSALLMQNHGLITIGHNLKEAYYRTEVVEDAARIFWVAATIGTPRTLTAPEADEIRSLEAERYRQRLLRDSSAAASSP